MMAGDGQNLMGRALLTRKKALAKAIRKLERGDRTKLAFVDHQAGSGAEMHEAACRIGLEGIVSKRIDAPYKPDDRSGIWTKAKCRASQELVVGGWKTTGTAFRSLIVGAHRGGKLVHVGTVGTATTAAICPHC